MVRPNPRHFGQAPMGELKEKRAGLGFSKIWPVMGDFRFSEKCLSSLVLVLKIKSSLLPKWRAICVDSKNRVRLA